MTTDETEQVPTTFGAHPLSGKPCRPPEHLCRRTRMLKSWKGRGVATKFCLGGRIHRHPNPPTPKFSFSSDFGHFILKMMENAKNVIRVKKKDAEISTFLGGRPPLIFRLQGTCPPVPPLSTPMWKGALSGRTSSCCLPVAIVDNGNEKTKVCHTIHLICLQLCLPHEEEHAY